MTVELMNLLECFRQKPRESVSAWLFMLWDIGAESVTENGLEISKLVSIVLTISLKQRIYAMVQHNEENHSSIQCLRAVCRIMWPNESYILVNTSLWTSMEELQTYITELGMRETIYDDTHESPDLLKFSTEMKELILQLEPPHQNGMLVFILNPLAALEAVVQEAAQLVTNS